MDIKTIITQDGCEYMADSTDLETHIEKLYGIERMIERLEKFPTCLHCHRKFDIGTDEKFCSEECAEEHHLDMKENLSHKES